MCMTFTTLYTQVKKKIQTQTPLLQVKAAASKTGAALRIAKRILRQLTEISFSHGNSKSLWKSHSRIIIKWIRGSWVNLSLMSKTWIIIPRIIIPHFLQFIERYKMRLLLASILVRIQMMLSMVGVWWKRCRMTLLWISVRACSSMDRIILSSRVWSRRKNKGKVRKRKQLEDSISADHQIKK